MPIYEYQCKACGKVTDVRHGFDEKNSEACPACGGALARLFSPTGIVFKGSGFYVTDSRKSSDGKTAAKAGADKNDSPTGESSKAGESKAEGSKPDAASSSESSSSGGAKDGGAKDGGVKKDATAAA